VAAAGIVADGRNRGAPCPAPVSPRVDARCRTSNRRVTHQFVPKMTRWTSSARRVQRMVFPASATPCRQEFSVPGFVAFDRIRWDAFSCLPSAQGLKRTTSLQTPHSLLRGMQQQGLRAPPPQCGPRAPTRRRVWRFTASERAVSSPPHTRHREDEGQLNLEHEDRHSSRLTATAALASRSQINDRSRRTPAAQGPAAGPLAGPTPIERRPPGVYFNLSKADYRADSSLGPAT